MLSTGLPMVFHTAPPHPASKARWICAPELVGGADASQNGLGDLMPAKSMDRSAMAHLQGRGRAGEERMNGRGGAFAVLHGHHGAGGSCRPHGIAAREDLGAAGQMSGVDGDITLVAGQTAKRQAR